MMTQYYEQGMWIKVARVVMAVLTVALGALFLLELAVVFRNESVAAWAPFAMFMGSLFWFLIVVMLLWEWKTPRHLLVARPNLFLTAQIACTLLLGVSLSPIYFETMKTYAMIADTLISFFFFSTFVDLYFGESWKQQDSP